MLLTLQLWVFIVLGIIVVWLLGISIWILRTSGYFALEQEEAKKFQNQDLEERLWNFEKTLQELGQKNLYNVQKVGVVKFNPFGDTGGDQSFAIALLNGRNSGIAILGLHGRETTRVYIKPVHEGRSEYELSKEELEAIAKAQAG